MMNNFKYKGFSASVEFSPDDELLIGKIADIDALIMFSADNIADLAAEFKASVDCFIAHCEEAGIEPSKPYKGTFNVRIGSETHRRIASIAKLSGVSLNEAMKRAAEEFVDRHSKPQIPEARVVYVAVKGSDLDTRIMHLHQKMDVSIPYEVGPAPRVGRSELRGRVSNPYGKRQH